MSPHESIAACLSALPDRYNAAAELLVGNLAAGRGKKIAYICDGTPWTFQALLDRVERFAGMLRKLGVEPEQRILLCLPDTIDFPAAFLGAIKAGVVPIPVSTILTAETYLHQLQDSRARLAIVRAELAGAFDTLAPRCPNLLRVIVAGGREDQTGLDMQLAAAAPMVDYADTHRDEPAFWLYTSGSTGNPKGVIHSHASLRLTADLYARPILDLGEADTVFSVAKLFFAYGLGNALTFPLSVGATTVLLSGRPTPAETAKVIAAHSVTVLCCSPTFLAGFMSQSPAPAKSELAGLRLAASAGEALPLALAQRFFDSYGVEILDGLGSTEMLHIFLSQRLGDLELGVGGRPVPGYGLKVVNDEGEQAADDEIGDLYVSGPTAALGYWNNRTKSLATFQGSWTRTGDKYSRNAEGYYRYCGRSDDMMKVSGIYVSPFDIENALTSHPAVQEAAVVGRADKQGLLKPHAYVVVAPSSKMPLDDLKEALRLHVKSAVAPHAYPRWIDVVPDLPKTGTGKIQRFKLREANQGEV